MSKTSVEVEAVISAHSVSQGNRMAKEFKPYVEADRFDKKLEKLEERYPIAKDNLHSWTLFHRTLQSTLILLEKQLEKVAKDAPT